MVVRAWGSGKGEMKSRRKCGNLEAITPTHTVCRIVSFSWRRLFLDATIVTYVKINHWWMGVWSLLHVTCLWRQIIYLETLHSSNQTGKNNSDKWTVSRHSWTPWLTHSFFPVPLICSDFPRNPIRLSAKFKRGSIAITLCKIGLSRNQVPKS